MKALLFALIAILLLICLLPWQTCFVSVLTVLIVLVGVCLLFKSQSNE